MAQDMLACCFLLAMAGSAAAAGLRLETLASASHKRALHNTAVSGAVQTAKQCVWDRETNSCDAADAVDIMYAVRGKPVSPYLWFLLMTHDRKNACDGHDQRDSCKADTANNCVWLDDVLGDGSKSKSRAGRAGTGAKASERSSAALAAAVPNLFSLQMAAVQQELGSSLREMLARFETPILNPALELAATAAAGGAAAPAAPAASTPAGSSTKPSSSSSGSSSSSSGSTGRKKAIKCTSRELIENFVFTRSGYSSVLQAPLALHCPGSKAFNLVKCMGQTSNAACSATPGCVVVPRVGRTKSSADLCVSQYFNKLTKEQMNSFMYALTLGEPAVVGSCDGACWMRQAMLCNHTVGADGCSALSFCRTMGSSCVPKLYAQDNFGSSVQEYLGECMEADNKRDCESYSLKLVNKGQYAHNRMPVVSGAKCFVPSVGTILGRQAAAGQQRVKEGAARTEMLTMMEAETDKQAAALAATTAAADAARAAKIMSERGATGLQQLYSSASSVLG